MALILEIVGAIVRIGMDAYDASKTDEAQALIKLDAALAGARVRIRGALDTLDAARATANARIDAAIKARGGK